MKSVEVDGEMRYSMLETLREYAKEKCEAENISPDLCARHAAYYLELAQTGSAQLDGPESGRRAKAPAVRH